MAYRTIDCVSPRINREKKKTASNASSNVKPSKSIKDRILKPRIKKQHLQKLASAYLMLLMIFQSLAGVFVWVPKGNEAKGADSFVFDSFTDTAGVLLENHASDTGNTWTKNSVVSSGSAVIANNRIYESVSGATYAIYHSSWTPASADYDVSADIYVASTNNLSGRKVGVGGRAGTSAFTGYYAVLVGGAAPQYVVLYRGGNLTPLGSYSLSLSTGQTHSIKLSMRGTNVKVYWDGVAVIDVTPTGANQISDTGTASVYLETGVTDTTGLHLDNFSAAAAILFPGTLSEVSHTASAATVSWTGASGGSSSVSSQLQRSSAGAGIWSDVSGAATSPVTDSGLSAFASYDYRVAYTDSVSPTVYSNTITVDTSNVYTVQQSDLWDNGYDNVSAPRQSTFSRFVFTTDAANIVVKGTTSIYGNYPAYAHLGVRINGADQSPLAFAANGTSSFSVSLGTAGTLRTVEVISGLQSKPSGTVLGTFVDSVAYPAGSQFSVSSPTTENRMLVYGDSISAGGNATNAESQAYVPLLRNMYNKRVMLEGWGYRSLYYDANTSALRDSFIGRIAGYGPSIVWIAIGTNDYGLNKWNAVDFGNAYAAILDGLHSALPSAKIICQTPISRGSEVANSFGNTLGNYRSQIINICAARSWATLVDGTALLGTSDLADGVHPTTAGHAKYALGINNVLTTAPTITTSTASDLDSTSAVLNGSIDSIGGTSPTRRSFSYGLTDSYEIATINESGSFSTGNFNLPVSGLNANTTYHFKACAINFAGSVCGTDQIFTTLAPAPTGFLAVSDQNSITLSADVFPNYNIAQSGYYFSRADLNSGWIRTNVWRDINLNCGKTYTYLIKYRNAEGIETAPIYITKSTAACSPAFISPSKPSVSNISISTTNGTLSLTNLPSNITQIAVSTLEDFKDASWEYAKDVQSILARYTDVAKLYIKFRTNDGAVSDVITYNPQTANNTQTSDTTTGNTNIILNDGDIVKTPSSPDIYVIKLQNNKKYKRLILSPQVFNSYHHLKWDNIKTISEEQLNQYQTSTLVKELNDTIVYTLTPSGDQGQRKPFDLTQTYDPDSIYTINKVDRDSYEWEE